MFLLQRRGATYSGIELSMLERKLCRKKYVSRAELPCVLLMLCLLFSIPSHTQLLIMEFLLKSQIEIRRKETKLNVECEVPYLVIGIVRG